MRRPPHRRRTPLKPQPSRPVLSDAATSPPRLTSPRHPVAVVFTGRLLLLSPEPDTTTSLSLVALLSVCCITTSPLSIFLGAVFSITSPFFSVRRTHRSNARSPSSSHNTRPSASSLSTLTPRRPPLPRFIEPLPPPVRLCIALPSPLRHHHRSTTRPQFSVAASPPHRAHDGRCKRSIQR
jgi:hypothetical protein